MKIKILGMTCTGCKETVTRALENIDNVKNVTVSLKNESAIIESEYELSIETLQHSLPEKYQIQKNISDKPCLLYTSPSPRDRQKSRMPSSA